MGDGDDTGAADQAQGGLDADDGVHGRRANDRAVGFGADGNGTETGGYRNSGTGAGATGIAVQGVGVLRLAAATAPAAGGAGGTEIGPLAQIGLAQDDRPCLAKLPGDKGVAPRDGTGQGQGTGCGGHAVGSVDVVLDENRNAVQRTAGTFPRTLDVERVSYLQSVRVEFDDGVEAGALFVELLYTVEVALDDLPGAERTGFHLFLQFENGQFFHVDRLRLPVRNGESGSGQGTRYGGDAPESSVFQKIPAFHLCAYAPVKCGSLIVLNAAAFSYLMWTIHLRPSMLSFPRHFQMAEICLNST